MPATPEQVDRLRRMIAEPTETTYTDAKLKQYIERKALVDPAGQIPLIKTGWPPEMRVNRFWIPTFDLHRAAAEIWGEKAAARAQLFAYSADGASFSRDQIYQHALQMERFHNARRSPSTIIQSVYTSDMERYDYNLSNPEEPNP